MSDKQIKCQTNHCCSSWILDHETEIVIPNMFAKTGSITMRQSLDVCDTHNPIHIVVFAQHIDTLN